jgi:hypothetical protein
MSACAICQGERTVCFRATVLRKYSVEYFYCQRCGFLQTEPPYWLDEAYSSTISKTDTGLLRRNIIFSRTLSVLLYFLLDRKGRYLDTAGGYGVLTRIMRDLGFDFYWTDKYCENLFALGFEMEKIQAPFTAVTAFEVLEHLSNPIKFLEKTLIEAQTKTIILSTELFQGNPPKPQDWPYYAFSSGQHVSFYQRRTLEFIAKTLGLNLNSHGNWHMLSEQNINPAMFTLLTSRVSFPLASYVKFRLVSKTKPDLEHLS